MTTRGVPSKPSSYETAIPDGAPVPGQPRQKVTSINAQVIRMGSVSMSFSDLDVMCELLHRCFFVNDTNQENFFKSESEKDIAREFIEAVESLR